MQLRPLSRGKKLDCGKRLRALIVPGRLLRISRALRRGVPAPLELGLAMLPARPYRVSPPLRILNNPHDVSRATYLAHPALHRLPPQCHRELRPRRVFRAGPIVASRVGVSPAGGELLGVAITVALDRSSVAGEAMPAAVSRRPAAGLRAADPAQRKKSGKPDVREVVELVERPERHALSVRAAE